jgi:hypothetical protein
VDRGHHGNAQCLPKDLTVSKTLVVVENVKTVVPHQFSQFEIGAEAEGLDLRKNPEAGRSELVEIQGRENLEGISRGQEIGPFPEKIEILDGVDDRSVQKKGEWWADDDVDFMAQLYQFIGQVGEVNTLPAAVWIPSITQQAYFQDILPETA